MVIEKVTIVFEAVMKGFKDFNKVLNLSFPAWSKNTEAIQEFGTEGHKVANRFRMLIQGVKGFRMEMLGLLFFGQAIQRFFLGLLKPSAELFGIFDLWRTTLQITFLPIMKELAPIIFDLNLKLMELNPTLQESIGWFSLVAGGTGGALEKVGMFSLGLSSLIIAAERLGGPLSFLSKIITAIGGAFLIINGIVDISHGKWEGLGTVILGIGVALLPYSGPAGLIAIALGGIVWAIIHYWDDIVDAFEKGINFLTSKLDWLIEKLTGAKDTIGKVGGATEEEMKKMKAQAGPNTFGPGVPPFAGSITPSLGGSIAPPSRQFNIGTPGGVNTTIINQNINIADLTKIQREIELANQTMVQNVTEEMYNRKIIFP